MSSILDNMYVVFTFIAFGFAFLGSYVIFDAVNGAGLFTAEQAASYEGFYTSLNSVSIFIVMALIIGSVASAYLIKTNPIFLFILIFLLVVQAIILPPIVNAFNEFAQSSDIAATSVKIDDTIFLLQLAPIISLIGSVLAVLVGLVAK